MCCHCELDFIANYFWIFVALSLSHIALEVAIRRLVSIVNWSNQIERSINESIFAELFSFATFNLKTSRAPLHFSEGVFDIFAASEIAGCFVFSFSFI